MDIPDQSRPKLWQNRDFIKLWMGQTVSVFGSLITRTALPFVAILFLNSSPMQVALLSSMDLLAGFLVGLFAGVWVDRFARRPILIGTDFARAILVLTVPLVALFGSLRIEFLYVIAFLSGAFSTLFDVAYTSYMPSLVDKEELLDGNSKLTATASAAEIMAFGSGGWLVQWLTPPFALIIDAITFIVSAISLLLIRKPEQRELEAPLMDLEENLVSPTIGKEIAEGFQAVWTHPELRAVALSQWAFDFGGRIFGTVFLLFVTRELGIAPGIQGMIYAIGGFTSLVGAVLVGKFTERLGFGRTMVVSIACISLGMAAVPLAPNGALLGILCLVLNQILTDPFWTVFDIGQVSLRQTVVGDRMQGRVNATFRVGSMAFMLVGTFLGGYLGEQIGLRNTIILGVLVVAITPMLIAFSPLARRRTLTPQEEVG